jgi:hypothetical protein
VEVPPLPPIFILGPNSLQINSAIYDSSLPLFVKIVQISILLSFRYMDFDQQTELAFYLERVSACEIRDLAVENALQIIIW